MAMEVQDKVAVITGASRGIGRAIALALAGAGAKVAAIATTTEGALATVRDIESRGGVAFGPACNVADEASVVETAKAIEERFGGVDILVNNAGVTRDGLLLRMKAVDWDTVLDTNLKGAFLMSRVFAKSLMKRQGRIINIASVVGLFGNAGQANYAASKGGLIALTKSLAKELASRQVRVNAVAPGFIETDMTGKLDEPARAAILQGIPLERFGSADDIAQAVLFLAGRGGEYITGQTLVVDGGMSM